MIYRPRGQRPELPGMPLILFFVRDTSCILSGRHGIVVDFWFFFADGVFSLQCGGRTVTPAWMCTVLINKKVKRDFNRQGAFCSASYICFNRSHQDCATSQKSGHAQATKHLDFDFSGNWLCNLVVLNSIMNWTNCIPWRGSMDDPAAGSWRHHDALRHTQAAGAGQKFSIPHSVEFNSFTPPTPPRAWARRLGERLMTESSDRRPFVRHYQVFRLGRKHGSMSSLSE